MAKIHKRNHGEKMTLCNKLISKVISTEDVNAVTCKFCEYRICYG